MSPEELRAQLQAVGESRYHSHHRFHRLLHAGELTKGQVQAWALNRYYYQSAIPRKDAALSARCEDANLRQVWRQRLLDHDGGDEAGDDEAGNDEAGGGLDRWLALTDAVGLERNIVTGLGAVLPATRFAVEAYVRFVQESSLLAAVASSLTEMFAPQIISERIAGMIASYDFIDASSIAYFEHRLEQAPRDAGFALEYVLTHAVSALEQAAVLDALRFKCDVLWAQLDGLYHAYVAPGHIPPGCFVPQEASREGAHHHR